MLSDVLSLVIIVAVLEGLREDVIRRKDCR